MKTVELTRKNYKFEKSCAASHLNLHFFRTYNCKNHQQNEILPSCRRLLPKSKLIRKIIFVAVFRF
jgi:hypothetical protein